MGGSDFWPYPWFFCVVAARPPTTKVATATRRVNRLCLTTRYIFHPTFLSFVKIPYMFYLVHSADFGSPTEEPAKELSFLLLPKVWDELSQSGRKALGMAFL